MKPVFGTPQGTGVGPMGGIATQTPTANVVELWIALMLVDQDEAAGIGQPCNVTYRRDAAERWQRIMEKPNCSSFVALIGRRRRLPRLSCPLQPFDPVLVIHLM
jgi:hypothetical protein